MNAVPAQPEKARHPAYRVWTDVPEEVRQERIQKALQRVLNDEKTEDIAKDLGISRSALNMAFLAYAEEDWKNAQVARAQTRADKVKDTRLRLETLIENCDSKDEAARLSLMLAHARDEEKSAQWELERLCRRIYGDDKLALNINGQGGMTVQLVSFSTSPSSQPVIEGESKREIDVTP